MATSPQFPATPKFAGNKVTTADGTPSKNHDGTSTGAVLLFTAGSNGSRIDEITAVPLGTNVATALRVFVNNGSANTTATNNFLYREVTMAANTISEVAGVTATTILSPDTSALVLPSGYKLYAMVGTTVAAGIQVNVVGGDY